MELRWSCGSLSSLCREPRAPKGLGILLKYVVDKVYTRCCGATQQLTVGQSLSLWLGCSWLVVLVLVLLVLLLLVLVLVMLVLLLLVLVLLVLLLVLVLQVLVLASLVLVSLVCSDVGGLWWCWSWCCRFVEVLVACGCEGSLW